MASSPSSRSASRSRYDVFLSFRGEDTRETFTPRLRGALRRKKINTFKDDEIVRGEEIAPALLKAIEESRISVVVFSKNYASSTWCLEELAHILECKEKYQQVVIPIFYRVDPSDVRYQRKSYAAFVHKQHFKEPDKVKWRDALTKASKLAGFVSHDFSSDSKLVEAVVEDLVMKLNRKSVAQDECFKCGQLGHWAKDCTSCDDDRNECFRCGDPGHWVRDCPYAGVQEMHGHGQAEDEDSSNDSFGERRSPRWEDVCFNCGCPGHWQNECPWR